MQRSGMLRPTCCKTVPVTELHLKHTLQIYATPPQLHKLFVGSRTFTAPLLWSPLIFSVLSSRCQQVGKLGHVLQDYLSLGLSAF